MGCARSGPHHAGRAGHDAAPPAAGRTLAQVLPGAPDRARLSAFPTRRLLRGGRILRALYPGIIMQAVHSVDLLLAYDWPYDRPFVHLLGEVFDGQGLHLLAVSPDTLEQAFSDLKSGRVAARAFLDRASDTDKAFIPLESWATANVPLQLNPGPRRRQVWIKTNLHWELD